MDPGLGGFSGFYGGFVVPGLVGGVLALLLTRSMEGCVWARGLVVVAGFVTGATVAIVALSAIAILR